MYLVTLNGPSTSRAFTLPADSQWFTFRYAAPAHSNRGKDVVTLHDSPADTGTCRWPPGARDFSEEIFFRSDNRSSESASVTQGEYGLADSM